MLRFLALVCTHIFCYASLVSEFRGLQNLLEGGKRISGKSFKHLKSTKEGRLLEIPVRIVAREHNTKQRKKEITEREG